MARVSARSIGRQCRRTIIAAAVVSVAAACAAPVNTPSATSAKAGSQASKPTVTTPTTATISAASLIGMGTGPLTRILGPADFRRGDGPAEVLQYRSASCVLYVFLYPDGTEGVLRVRHVEALNPQLQPVESDQCLSTLIHSQGTSQRSG